MSKKMILSVLFILAVMYLFTVSACGEEGDNPSEPNTEVTYITNNNYYYYTNIITNEDGSPYPELTELIWEETNDVVILTRYLGTDKTVVIPPGINGKPVSKLSNTFNRYNTGGAIVNITNVVIPTTVTNIGPKAFGGDILAYGITLPYSIIVIENNAFIETEFTDIFIPASVKLIESGAIVHTELTNMVLEVTGSAVIEGGAFNLNDYLKTVEILSAPPSVFGGDPFASCPALTAIKVPASEYVNYTNDVNWAAHTNIIVTNW
ncbi:MAG TPA: leucine-rich repeat domain-containing protein [Spirochaetota bacterium]|nr:leucine-rich repeat domain-containing protein [Spirochaetota bacterium]